MKKLFLLLLAVCTFSLISCGVSSHDETETCLQGKWLGAYDDYTNGLHVELHPHFKKATHSFTQTVDVFDLDDYSYLFSINYQGTWKASSTKLQMKISPSSVTYEYGPDINPLEFGYYISEMEAEFEKNPTDITEIVFAGIGGWTERDDEGNVIEYEPVRNNN